MNLKKSIFANPFFYICVLVAILLALRATNRGKAAALIPIADRKPAVETSWSLPDGSTWNLSAHKGKVVVVNYFATWCPPCVREMPDIVKTVGEHSADVTALAISLDQSFDPVKPFAEKWKINFPIAHGFGDPRVQLIESIPVTSLFDRQGRHAKTYTGMLTEDELEADLQKLIAETP